METAGLQENEKMTGYLDYLGSSYAPKKATVTEAADTAPPMSAHGV